MEAKDLRRNEANRKGGMRIRERATFGGLDEMEAESTEGELGPRKGAGLQDRRETVEMCNSEDGSEWRSEQTAVSGESLSKRMQRCLLCRGLVSPALVLGVHAARAQTSSISPQPRENSARSDGEEPPVGQHDEQAGTRLDEHKLAIGSLQGPPRRCGEENGHWAKSAWER
eukprot:9751-Pleurochrysis_carterae.AAC.1